MVGVPGKNNGCHTCRRRRLACDRVVPDCLRCHRSGLVCEGYARSTVFIHRTANGLSRRRYFDEAQLRSTEKQRPLDGVGEQFRIVKPIGYSDSLGPALRGHFLDTWLPSSKLPASPLGEWMIRACGLVQPGELLSKSLNALTITMTGHQRNDPAMIQCGQMHYGIALNALQRAVSDPQLVMEDDTLAALQAVRLYELSLSTGNVLENNAHHVKGSTQLLMLRGARKTNSPISKAILRDLRYAAMGHALQTQTRSPLGDSEWRTRNPRSHEDWENSLTDLGYDLAALIDEFRTASRKKSKDPAIDTFVRQEYPPRARAIGQELKRWFKSAVENQQISSKWPYPMLAEIPARATTEVGRRDGIDLALLREALLITDYWGLSLALEIVMDMLGCAGGSQDPPDTETFDERRQRQLNLSHNIFAVAKYQAREEHGFNAASRCTLATRAALYPLRTHDAPGIGARRIDAEEFLEGLTRQRGIRFAAALMNRKGDWKEGKDVSVQASSAG